MAWTLGGYNAVISAEQALQQARLTGDKAAIEAAEESLRRAKDAISNIAPGFVRGLARSQEPKRV